MILKWMVLFLEISADEEKIRKKFSKTGIFIEILLTVHLVRSLK